MAMQRVQSVELKIGRHKVGILRVPVLVVMATLQGLVKQEGKEAAMECQPLNERELKRERQKQSNCESARRSRLRKQAEAEELARKVDALTAENMLLKSELNQLAESSKKLRGENATLRENLKNDPLGQTEEIILNSTDSKKATPVSTENLLSRVNNSSSDDRRTAEDNDFCENKPNSGAKLRQLMDTNPRADAVAAG